MPLTDRLRPLVTPAAAVADGAYLLAWWTAPAAAWSPWAVLAGLAVAGWALGRNLACDEDWPHCVLPAALPCTSARRALRRRLLPALPGPWHLGTAPASRDPSAADPAQWRETP